ncbi:MAG: metallophosphoesterase [Planctomycetes bacterium]|jgi:predicted phosphodiesterase|nr:metallophosphoesterase [Planctomycetota bacterium]
MLAVISDIHSNTEALRAVLDDIRRRKIETILCLGDIVGYGPDPGPCLDMVMDTCETVIMGNHDYAVLYEPARFNLGAEQAVFWTRRTLENDPNPQKVARRWEFLAAIDVRITRSGEAYGMGELTFVHGSPRRPVNEYLFPDDIYNSPDKVTGVFERFEHVCFCGHTHVPGVFTDGPDFYSPDDLDGTFEVTGSKALINVGSVGQPRDRDPRCCYVVVEPGNVHFVRVEYDPGITMRKVHRIPDLDDYLGTRLQEGR